jgi:hypothetical protein
MTRVLGLETAMLLCGKELIQGHWIDCHINAIDRLGVIDCDNGLLLLKDLIKPP